MEKTYRKIFSRIGFCYFLLMGITFLAQNIFTLALISAYPNAINESWFIWIASYVPMYLIAVPAFLFALKIMLPKSVVINNKKDVSVSKMLLLIVVAFGGMYILNIVSTGILYLLQMLLNVTIVNPIESTVTSSNMTYNLIFACVVAPVGEEFIFRKKLYDKVAPMGEMTYILLSGIIFGLFHGNLSQFLYATALGMIFAYLYAKTKNIWYPILLHSIINIFGAILAPMALESVGTALVVSGVVWFSMVGCVAILSMNFSKIKSKFTQDVELKSNIKLAFLNLGMIVYILFCIATIVFTVIASI